MKFDPTTRWCALVGALLGAYITIAGWVLGYKALAVTAAIGTALLVFILFTN